MGKFEDLSGQRFGKWTIVGRADDYVSPKGCHFINWLCECDCGKVGVVRGCNLKNGKSTSCGCNRVEHPNRLVHGKSHTRIHNIWKGIKNRCFNENDIGYPDYGGRGIKMCELWKNDFMEFYRWSMTHGYSDELSIDRIDNNSLYSPDNCRWADAITQANNKRVSHYLTYQGKTMTISQWAKELNLNRRKIKDRINKLGWNIDRTLTTR